MKLYNEIICLWLRIKGRSYEIENKTSGFIKCGELPD
jgi:hypothetical protein